MVLARATIRDKLNLLLLVPLLATVLLALPFVAARVDEARAASLTAEAATNARQMSDVLYAVQQERLAAVDHLTVEGHQHSLMLQHEARVDDAIADLRARLANDDNPRLRKALQELDGLPSIRKMVRGGDADPEKVYNHYLEITDALFGTLGLQVQTGGSEDTNRQLETLDTLLRANEQSSRVGAALLVAAVDHDAGRSLLVEATALRQLQGERFRDVATPSLVALMRSVDEGASTKVLNRLADDVRDSDGHLDGDFVTEARGIAETQAVLRQLLLVRTVRQIETAAAEGADRAIAAAWAVGVGTVLVIALVVALGISVSRSIAGPVRHLTRAATSVAELASTELARVSDDEDHNVRPPRLAAIAVQSRDEIGDLAHAFNKVQATAALLLERQANTRRNVGLMFASVARRTQNLVGGQLALIDQMERNEQDPKVLADLYRLDHLSMRLRRSAESLLVVSGVRDETRLAVPAQLATVLRSALAEIQDFQRVRLVAVTDVTIAPSLVADLTLLLAELLENATSFSPPTMVVEVTAELNPSGCRIAIVDHGIGMPPEQMAEENERFLSRERLDVAPTTVLGLFVVGRLARRHGLAVELRPTPGGGVTAVVGIPARLFTTEPHHGSPVSMETIAAPPPTARGGAIPPAFAGVAVSDSGSDFAWFVKDEEAHDDPPTAGPPGASAAAHGAAAMTGVPPGQSDPAGAPTPGPTSPYAPAGPDPYGVPGPRGGTSVPAGAAGGAGTPDPTSSLGAVAASGAAMAGTAASGAEQRSGLTRRVPGASLRGGAQPAQQRVDTPPPKQAPLRQRDPEKERATLDDFTSAVARAAAETDHGRRTDPGTADEGSTA